MENEKDNNKLFLVLLLVGATFYWFYLRKPKPMPKTKESPVIPEPSIGSIVQGQQPEAMGMPKTEDYKKYTSYYEALRKADQASDKEDQQQAMASKMNAYANMILKNPLYLRLTKSNAVAAGNSLAKQLKIESKWLVRQGAQVQV